MKGALIFAGGALVGALITVVGLYVLVMSHASIP